MIKHEEELLRDKLFILSGCEHFGDQDGMNGCCIDCYNDNPHLHQRCCLFQTAVYSYRKNKNNTRY